MISALFYTFFKNEKVSSILLSLILQLNNQPKMKKKQLTASQQHQPGILIFLAGRGLVCIFWGGEQLREVVE